MTVLDERLVKSVIHSVTSRVRTLALNRSELLHPTRDNSWKKIIHGVEALHENLNKVAFEVSPSPVKTLYLRGGAIYHANGMSRN
jgi:hypothetical protein